MTPRRARWMLIIGVVGLVTMRAAYDLTYEPAPAVRVEWRKDTPAWRRTMLEHWYRLEDPQAPHGDSYAYVLFDTTERNIRGLVTSRYVVGTGDIDRTRFAVPWLTMHESDRFMWMADRIPLLRYPALRWGLMGMLMAATVVGARRL